MTFDDWWDADQLTQTNPYSEDSPAYWAWEGWQASRAALIAEIKAGEDFIMWGSKKHYTLPDEGEV